MRKRSLPSSARRQSVPKIPTKHNFFRTQLIGIATISALLCLGVVLRVANFSNVSSRSPDERVYTLQAKILLEGRKPALRSLIAEFQRDPDIRDYPPPTRLGYLLPLAAAMQLSGRKDESVGAWLSCAASIGSLFILALIGVRFFPFWATFFALLFFAVSPMELAISRRAWTDTPVEFLGFSLLYVAAEITRDSTRRIWYLLFVVLGSVSVAVKESGLVGYGFCAIWVLWLLLIERREWTNAFVLMAGGLAGLAITISCLAMPVGGLSVLTSIVTSIPGSNAINQYATEYQSGPGYLLLRGLEVMSPIAAILSLIGCGVVLFSHRKLNLLYLPPEAAHWQVLRWITLFMLSYLALPLVLPHWLNLRYISVLFGPFYLLGGLGFWYCASLGWNRLQMVARRIFAGLVIAALSIVAVTDYHRFQRIFVRDAVKDLSIKAVLDANKHD